MGLAPCLATHRRMLSRVNWGEFSAYSRATSRSLKFLEIFSVSQEENRKKCRICAIEGQSRPPGHPISKGGPRSWRKRRSRPRRASGKAAFCPVSPGGAARRGRCPPLFEDAPFSVRHALTRRPPQRNGGCRPRGAEPSGHYGPQSRETRPRAYSLLPRAPARPARAHRGTGPGRSAHHRRI